MIIVKPFHAISSTINLMLPMVNIHVRFLILSFPKTHWQKSIKLYSRVFKSQLIYLAHEFIVLAEDLKIFSSFPVCTAVVQPKNDLLQSNQYKTTTLGNTQKWCPGQVIVLWNTFIKRPQTKSDRSWQVFSFAQWIFYKQKNWLE